MSMTLHVQRQCSRCPRVESTPVSIADVVKLAAAGKNEIPEPPSVFVARLGDREVTFPSLCDECVAIVGNMLTSIDKKLEKQSSTRDMSKTDE